MRFLPLLLAGAALFAMSQEEQDKAWAEAMRESAAMPARKAESAPAATRTQPAAAAAVGATSSPRADYKPVLTAYANGVASLAASIGMPGEDEPNLPTDTAADRQRKNRIAIRNQAARMATARLEELRAAIKSGNDLAIALKCQAVMEWVISYENELRPGQ